MANKTETAVNAGQLLWQPSFERMENSGIAAFRQWVNTQYQHAFSDYNALWRWSIDKPEQFWESVWHAPYAIEAIDPSALAIRPALAEILGLVASDLEQQAPILVGVIVFIDDWPQLSLLAGVPWLLGRCCRLSVHLRSVAVSRLFGAPNDAKDLSLRCLEIAIRLLHFEIED